jgi:Na+-translocating ferredoxin:NAD+ oxidoreductase RnfD subunit
MFKKKLNIKIQLIVFLTVLASFLIVKNKNIAFLYAILISVISCLSTDVILNYIKKKQKVLTSSSIITGLIIGYVLASDTGWLILMVTSFIAIASKHFIQMNNRHIFNPAGFGIVVSMLVFKAQTQWYGTYFWYLFIPVGLYFAYKIRKLELVFSYLIVSILLFGMQFIMNEIPVINIVWMLSYFFIFIMLIEPKTTPHSFAGKIVFGIGVVLISFLLTKIRLSLDVQLAGLLVLNIFIVLINKIPKLKGVLS